MATTILGIFSGSNFVDVCLVRWMRGQMFLQFFVGISENL